MTLVREQMTDDDHARVAAQQASTSVLEVDMICIAPLPFMQSARLPTAKRSEPTHDDGSPTPTRTSITFRVHSPSQQQARDTAARQDPLDHVDAHEL